MVGGRSWVEGGLVSGWWEELMGLGGGWAGEWLVGGADELVSGLREHC